MNIDKNILAELRADQKPNRTKMSRFADISRYVVDALEKDSVLYLAVKYYTDNRPEDVMREFPWLSEEQAEALQYRSQDVMDDVFVLIRDFSKDLEKVLAEWEKDTRHLTKKL